MQARKHTDTYIQENTGETSIPSGPLGLALPQRVQWSSSELVHDNIVHVSVSCSFSSFTSVAFQWHYSGTVVLRTGLASHICSPATMALKHGYNTQFHSPSPSISAKIFNNILHLHWCLCECCPKSNRWHWRQIQDQYSTREYILLRVGVSGRQQS